MVARNLSTVKLIALLTTSDRWGGEGIAGGNHAALLHSIQTDTLPLYANLGLVLITVPQVLISINWREFFFFNLWHY